MIVKGTRSSAADADADTIVVGLVEDETPPPGLPPELLALIDAGEARARFRSLALAHADGKRWLSVGVGPRRELTAERVRVAAALAAKRAGELRTRTLYWLPPDGPAELAAAAVEGTVLGDYRFEHFKSK